jgi:hypothetical protein
MRDVLGEKRGRLWLPAKKPATLKAAGKFVGKVGLALLFPSDKIMVPSLYEAIAEPDAVAWAEGMGEVESVVWGFKDELPEAGLAWSGKLIHKRASLLSPELLALLYRGDGEPEDHRQASLLPEAHRIADALAGGPLPTSVLREIVGDKARYDRCIVQLQQQLLVTSVGTFQQRSGWPAVLMDLTCRAFTVGGQRCDVEAAAVFLATVFEAGPAQLAKAFGWSTAEALSTLEALAKQGRAARDGKIFAKTG